MATTVHANRMKHFYDPADRPIAPPQEFDPNQLSLQAADLPADSFEPENSETKPSTPIDAAPKQENGELPNGTPVDSSDVLKEPHVYAAEKILKVRKRNGKHQYLVKWANFPASESTWEPEENILDKRLLENFHSNQS